MKRPGFLARVLRGIAALWPSMPGGWGYWNAIREPFRGAWQRNMGCSEQSLLAYSGVFACCTIIAGDVAKLPVHVYRVKEDGEREEATTHWAFRLFRKPNAYQTRFDLVQQFMASLLLTGNAYLFFEQDDRSAPIAMHVLDPRRTQFLVSEESGDVFYAVKRSPFSQRAEEIVWVPATLVLHHRVFTTAHPLQGVSPLVAAAQSAGTGLRIGLNSEAFFENSARPSGVLTTPPGISEADAKRLQAEWKEAFSKGNTGNVAMLTTDLKWLPLGMTAEDAQLIDQLRWSLNDVARCFRVPPFMLGDMEKTSFRNSEQLMRNYYSGCLQSQIEALENRFETFFEFGPDMQIEFDLAELLRTDLDVRYKAYSEGISSGFLTINEARARESLPRIAGGDEPLVQMQYRPLSQAIRDGASTPPAATPADATPAASGGADAPDAEAEAEAAAAQMLARVMAP